MRFWIREIAGWFLIATGLAIFYLSYRLLTDEPGHFLLEAGPLVFAGFVVFRGGIHLLKVAVAARICLQAQQPPGRAGGVSPLSSGAQKANAPRSPGFGRRG